jgi:hypothetical protein
MDGVTQLVSELFIAIKLIAGYPVPMTLPEIHVLTPAALRQSLCKGPCGDIKAYYLPGKGIFISDRLDLQRDVADRSVLLHELVHHAQELSGKFNQIPGKCDRWYSRELEAYSAQNQYLRDNAKTVRFLMDSLPKMCGDGQSFGAQD